MLALLSARNLGSDLGEALRGDLERFKDRLERVVVAGTAAEFASLAPGALLGDAAPWIGRDIGVVRSVAQTAGEGSRAGLAAFEDLQAIAGRGSLAQAIYRNGRLDFVKLEQLRRRVVQAGPLLDDFVTRFESTQPTTFLEVYKARAKLLRALAGAREAIETADRLLRTIPQLAGRDTVKRYLLALQSPSEARGGGGLIGLYGVLRADGGRVSLEKVESILELNENIRRPVSAPGWYVDLYGSLQALEELRHANLGIHFPTIGRILLEFYEQAEGEELDGVITLDPIVLEQLTRATGPLEGPGWDVKVGPKNARRVLLHDVYLRFGQYHSREQNLYLRGLVDHLLQRLDSGHVKPFAMAEALTRVAKWKHLKIYARDSELQAALGALDLDADPTSLGPHVQAMWHNNFTGSKVDYFLHRTVAVDVTLDATGTASVATHITLDNRTPTSPSSLLIRPLRRRFPNGHNRMTFSIGVPEGARRITYSKNGSRRVPLRGREDSLPVVWDPVDIPAMEQVEIDVNYEIDRAVVGDKFEFSLWPQALVRPDTFSVTVHPPSGRSFADVFPRRRLDSDGSYVLEGRLFGPKTVRATFD